MDFAAVNNMFLVAQLVRQLMGFATVMYADYAVNNMFLVAVLLYFTFLVP
jgi:hypothetical protein